ncbi:F0F1 ATP synthase subunit epsilon [Rhodobacterales bacterium FZCC0083]|jgi:F-type H+-transporting ATPase subunit epsilon|nr:F0F1 ATP synthase subunit epsilon [Rhodobacterales bacterium FZCC0083]
MANTMQFDLVSPEKLLSSQQVEAVLIPGADGDMMAMPGHAPVITSLRPGILRVQTAAGSEEYVVTGGFAEIGESVSVLAEKAVLSAELTQEGFEALVEEAKSAYGKAQEAFANEPGPVDDAAKMLSDMVAVGDQMGLSGTR